MSLLRYAHAARHFAEAAKHLPEVRSELRLGYLDQEADGSIVKATSAVITWL